MSGARMSSHSKWKLLTALVLIFAALGVIGWQSVPPAPVPPTTIMITPTATTVSATQTTIVPVRRTEWIQVGQVRPINYYLSLLESNGTQPYVQLSKELQRLPDLTNATALAKITYLALNATNPEVKEALELMMKGGTPDQRDFSYSVPSYNTELQVFCWLACQNEFKKDDTLILSIAMVHGLWVTMGDERVRQAVRKDTSDLLVFFRETNELQKERGYYQLEDYPLEAKIALAWTGNDVSTHGWYGLSHQAPVDYRRVKLPLGGYNWNTVSVATLRAMRQLMDEKGWVDNDVDVTACRIGDFFWNNLWYGGPSGFRFQDSFDVKIVIDGEEWPARNMNNADFEFEHFLEHGKGIGVCEDNMVLRDAFLKSWGIATLPFSVYFSGSGDTQPIHYNPLKRIWKLYDRRLMDQRNNYDLVRFEKYDLYIFKPPVVQPGYFDRINNSKAAEVDPIRRGEVNNSFYPLFNLSPKRLYEILIVGAPTSQMKQWLLYS